MGACKKQRVSPFWMKGLNNYTPCSSLNSTKIVFSSTPQTHSNSAPVRQLGTQLRNGLQLVSPQVLGSAAGLGRFFLVAFGVPVSFWFAPIPNREVPLGPTNRKRMERAMQAAPCGPVSNGAQNQKTGPQGGVPYLQIIFKIWVNG